MRAEYVKRPGVAPPAVVEYRRRKMAGRPPSFPWWEEGGKSEHLRVGCPLTAGRGDPTESATETYRPSTLGG